MKIIKTTLVFILPLMISCSLIGDAVDVTSRRSKELSLDQTVEGSGFRVRTPAQGLYPVHNLPTRGAVTFRPVEPMFDGLVYFVAPFPSNASSLEAALSEWVSIPASRGQKVTVIEQRSVRYNGAPAREAVIQVEQGSGGQIAAILITGKTGRYFIVNSGDRYVSERNRQSVITRCKARLQTLKTKTILSNG